MVRIPRAASSNPQTHHAALYAALAGFFTWTLATWLLEGRLQTLLRPEAELNRLLYTGIANIAIGQIGGLALLGLLFRWTNTDPAPAHVRPLDFRLLRLIAATALGLGYYLIAGGRFDDAAVAINAFAQVFVVSAAEVIVCWGLLGFAAEASLRPLAGRWSVAGAAIAASSAFGLYHFAHSPPFNEPLMVAFLTLVGLITSLFFFVTRDLLATILFHNFPAAAGVTDALTAGDVLDPLTHLQLPLLATAVLSLMVLLAGERVVFARRR